MKTNILVLVTVIVLAGCTGAPSLPDSGEDEEPPAPPKGILVDGPSCKVDGEPCTTGLTEYSIPKVSLTIENAGGSGMALDLSTYRLEGRNLLTSMCDTYRLEEFRAHKETAAGRSDVKEQRTVQLAPDQSLTAEWFVSVKPGADTGNSTIICPFNFDMAFEQSLSSSQQVQVREHRDIPITAQLDNYTSSVAPVELVIDTTDEMVNERIGGDWKPLVAKSYLINNDDGNIVDITSQSPYPVDLSAGGVQSQTCAEQQVTVYNGDRTEQHAGTVCRFIPGRVSGSQIFDIQASASYEYEKPLNGISLRLAPVEVRR